MALITEDSTKTNTNRLEVQQCTPIHQHSKIGGIPTCLSVHPNTINMYDYNKQKILQNVARDYQQECVKIQQSIPGNDKRTFRPNAKNVISTSTKKRINEVPESKHPTNLVFASMQQKGKIYSYQTGRFTYISSTGYQYVFSLYANYANAILAEPIKNWSLAEINQSYVKTVTMSETRGHKPQVYW